MRSPMRSTPHSISTWRNLLFALLGMAATASAVVWGNSSDILAWGVNGLSFYPWAWLLVPLLYTIPGFALIRLLPIPSLQLGPTATLIFAWACSIALPPLLLLIAQVVGLPWGTLTVVGYLLTSALIIFWPRNAWHTWAAWRSSARTRWQRIQLHEEGGALSALVAISLAALVVRLYAIRDLPVGMFGDSYHHTMITQLLVDNGGIFASWQPYAPLATFTYHFGFHSQAALLHWLTGIPVHQAVLISGQILNAAAAPMAFLLVKALRGTAWAGAWAALLVAFVMELPGFYVSWGRYTQLTGQIVLVAVVVAWMHIAEQATWRSAILAGILTAAMMLTHYLVTFSAALFVASYLLIHTLAQRTPLLQILRLMGWAGVSCLLAIMLTTPWFANVVTGYLVRNAEQYITSDRHAAVTPLLNLTQAAPGWPAYLPGYLLPIALFGLCIAAWQRHWHMTVPLAWGFALWLLYAPFTFGLPGTGMIDSLTSLSALYIPVSLLIGYALASMQMQSTQWLTKYSPTLASTIPRTAWLIMLVVIAWGSSWQARIVDLRYQLVTHADMTAMAWIRENTPADARFVVNGFPAYAGTLVAGSDAGWWIPLLTSRQSTLPPITIGSELGDPPEVYNEVVERWALLRERPLSDARPGPVDLVRPDALAALRAAGVTHVYLGAHASPGREVADWIDVELLRASPAFTLVYAQDGVEIFALGEGP